VYVVTLFGVSSVAELVRFDVFFGWRVGECVVRVSLHSLYELLVLCLCSFVVCRLLVYLFRIFGFAMVIGVVCPSPFVLAVGVSRSLSWFSLFVWFAWLFWLVVEMLGVACSCFLFGVTVRAVCLFLHLVCILFVFVLVSGVCLLDCCLLSYFGVPVCAGFGAWVV
jgi:hypothetical protein